MLKYIYIIDLTFFYFMSFICFELIAHRFVMLFKVDVAIAIGAVIVFAVIILRKSLYCNDLTDSYAGSVLETDCFAILSF